MCGDIMQTAACPLSPNDCSACWHESGGLSSRKRRPIRTAGAAMTWCDHHEPVLQAATGTAQLPGPLQ